MACFVHSILFMVKWLRRMALRDTGFYTNTPTPCLYSTITGYPATSHKAPNPACLALEKNPSSAQPHSTEVSYRTELHKGIPRPGSDYERFNCNNFNVRY
jgi:hypothetical protein